MQKYVCIQVTLCELVLDGVEYNFQSIKDKNKQKIISSLYLHL